MFKLNPLAVAIARANSDIYHSPEGYKARAEDEERRKQLNSEGKLKKLAKKAAKKVRGKG